MREICSWLAGWLESPRTPVRLTTTALTRLSRKTVPSPPRPACLKRTLPRRTSYQLKLRHPIRVCSAPLPADTTEMSRRSASESANSHVRSFPTKCVSVASSGASRIVTLPALPSIKTITSCSALPWISSASQPENFSSGPKYPPTLLSITEWVSGEMPTTSDLPAPGKVVVPPRGPEEILISFSGSSHRV